MSFDEALMNARQMCFADKSEEDLHRMLIVIGNHAGQHSDTYTLEQIPHAVRMIQGELSRRQRSKNHQEAVSEQQRLHQKATEQGTNLHGETMGELEKLKTSVDRLSHARWIDWAILIAGSIAAIAAVILLFR